MSGKIDIISYAIIVISLISSITDLLWRKIFNWITFPAALSGLAFSFYSMGWVGIGESILGIFAGIVLYGWMFGLRVAGGGDVKLLMALGAWGGFHFSVEVAILGILIGGLISLAILIVTGKLLDFSKRVYIFFLSVFVKELEVQALKIDKQLTMPFGVSISIAAVWTNFSHPLSQWGLLLWR